MFQAFFSSIPNLLVQSMLEDDTEARVIRGLSFSALKAVVLTNN